MPKKSTSRAKEIQQRNKQAQWQRRVAAQGGAVVSATPLGVEDDGVEGAPVGMGTDAHVSERGGTATRAAAPRSRVPSPVGAGSGGGTRRATTSLGPARGSARLRMAANQMSLEDEMSYVRSDIRRLVILTAICLIVLVALSFVIR